MRALVLLFFFASVANADYHALCVGVDTVDAKNEKKLGIDCPFCRDAIHMSELLKSKGFRTKLLHGKEAAIDYEVLGAVRRIAKRSKDGDVTVLFFSTHGVLSRTGTDFGIVTAEDILASSRVIKTATEIKGLVIIAVDACHAGMLAKMEMPQNFIIFSSCQIGEKSA